MRTLPVLLALALLAPAGAALATEPPPGAPAMEQLPPVDYGPDAVKGDYLDLAPEKKEEPKRTVKIRVNKQGIEPRFFELKKGELVKLVITREVENACPSLSSPDLKIDVELEVGKPAEVLVTPDKTGNFPLSCLGGRVAAGIKVN